MFFSFTYVNIRYYNHGYMLFWKMLKKKPKQAFMSYMYTYKILNFFNLNLLSNWPYLKHYLKIPPFNLTRGSFDPE